MLQKMTGQELAQLIREEEEHFIINETELNITCCIMMLDMLLKQVHFEKFFGSTGRLNFEFENIFKMNLQKLAQCLGMYNPVSKELMALMNKHLILPWTKRHKCKTIDFSNPERDSRTNPSVQFDSQNYCSFCEEYVLWSYFAKQILLYISPKQEIEVPEIQLYDLVDSSSSKLQAHHPCYHYFYQQSSVHQGVFTQKPRDDGSVESAAEPTETNADNDVWLTSFGTYYFKLSNLHIHLQLMYSLLKELGNIPDVDSLNNTLIALKMLVLHGEALESAAKDQKGFLVYCLEKLMVPR